MSRGTPPQRVPTLTEVVEPSAERLDVDLSTPSDHLATQRLFVRDGLPVAEPSQHSEPSSPPSDSAQRMMAELQTHIDGVLDTRLRAALEPMLAQLIARVTEETRRELASTLRDGMNRALAQEMSRHRGEPLPR